MILYLEEISSCGILLCHTFDFLSTFFVLFQAGEGDKTDSLQAQITRLRDDVSVRDQENSYLARKIQKDTAKIILLQKNLTISKQNEHPLPLPSKKLIETEYEFASKYFTST